MTGSKGKIQHLTYSFKKSICFKNEIFLKLNNYFFIESVIVALWLNRFFNDNQKDIHKKNENINDWWKKHNKHIMLINSIKVIYLRIYL